MASINVENMRAWVAALRSGKYQQGRNTLRTVDGRFCCLGVACDISGLAQWTDHEVRGFLYDGRKGVLPPRVAEWLGIDTNPELLPTHESGQTVPASNLNDGFGYTFDEIADAIEETWPEVKTGEARGSN